MIDFPLVAGADHEIELVPFPVLVEADGADGVLGTSVVVTELLFDDCAEFPRLFVAKTV